MMFSLEGDYILHTHTPTHTPTHIYIQPFSGVKIPVLKFVNFSMSVVRMI